MKSETIILFVFLSCIVIYLYVRLKGKNFYDQDGYGLLSYFSDTILFRYDCRSQTLTFTPNLNSRFTDSDTRTFRFSDRDKPPIMIHPEDIDSLRRRLCQRGGSHDDCCENLNIRFLDKDGEYRWMFCQLKAVSDRKGNCIAMIGKLSDIQEQRCKEERLIEKASLDAMTGVLNREAVESRITAMLQKTKHGFLFMIDIDNFKTINDSQGHSAGDDALVRFAAEIKNTFGQNGVIGRAGGDEFVVFLADADAESIAREKAQQLLDHLSKWGDLLLSASIGIAAYPCDGHTYGQLYEAADTAMYRVKQQGKNSYRLSEKQYTAE